MTDSIRLPATFEEALADFDPVDADAWRARVEKDLKGADFERVLVHTTRDGVAVRSLRHETDTPTAEDPAGFPGEAPYTRGVLHLPDAWQVAQEFDFPDPEAGNARLLHDLETLGFDLLWLVADDASRLGVDPAEEPGLVARRGVSGDGVARGVPLASAESLRALLAGVDLTMIDLVVESGGNPAIGHLVLDHLAATTGEEDEIAGSLGVDPLGALAADGRLPGSLEAVWKGLADLVRRTLDEQPGVRAALVDTVPFHDAGAPPATELGLGLAGYAETLRRLAGEGVDPTKLPGQVLVRHAVGRDIFLEIAKFRAWRRLVAKVESAAGLGDGGEQDVVARASAVELSVVDPWVNLLRATAQAFTAAVAGADAIVVHPFDRLFGHGPRDAHSRRVASNLHNVLRDEAHLAHVVDPAGGSWAVEDSTDRLARAAWGIFREIEAEGGLGAAILSGAVHERIARAREARETDLAKRKEAVVGVSVFPNLGETRPDAATPDLDLDALAKQAADASRSADDVSLVARTRSLFGEEASPEIDPLPRFRAPAAFERLRLAVDEQARATGKRPKVFLANLGEPADHRARTEFAQGVFSVAGLETVAGESTDYVDMLRRAFLESGADVACLCSSDEIYARRAASAARGLAGAGASLVYLAGRPGEHEAEYRDAGVDDFLYLGCDVHALLESLLELLGFDLPPDRSEFSDLSEAAS